MRRFLRHPVDIPIEYTISEKNSEKSAQSGNMSISGLCFIAKHCIEIDKFISIKIPLIDPDFQVQGKVVRCVKKNEHVEIGVEFITEHEAYTTRMIEQVCYIKQYQKDIARKEGRNLTDKEAALEWIQNHAAQFPK
jgi:hypothetical protein